MLLLLDLMVEDIRDVICHHAAGMMAARQMWLHWKTSYYHRYLWKAWHLSHPPGVPRIIPSAPARPFLYVQEMKVLVVA